MKHIKLVETIFYVNDQQKSAEFYQNIFRQNPDLNVPGMTEFTLNNFTKIGLMPNDGIAKIVAPTLPHPELGNGIPRCELYLTITDLEDNFERILKAGAKLISPISARDWGDNVGYIADFDGHVIALASKT